MNSIPLKEKQELPVVLSQGFKHAGQFMLSTNRIVRL
jgi:hypothetical protein